MLIAFRRALAAALVTVGVACSEPFASSEVAGLYVAASVNDVAMPDAEFADEQYEYRFAYDSLTVYLNGTARTVRHWEYRELPAGAWVVLQQTVEWSFRIEGRYLQLRYESGLVGVTPGDEALGMSLTVDAPNALIRRDPRGAMVFTRR